MRSFRPAIITLAISAVLFAAGCAGDASNSNTGNAAAPNTAANTSKANTNAEELGLLINFGWETEDLAWKKDDARKTLVAAFRLSPDDAKKLSEQLAAKGQGAPKEVAVEEWFPSELIAQGETSGGSSTVPATAFPAADLFQPPYTEGTISRVNETDYFIVELHAR